MYFLVLLKAVDDRPEGVPEPAASGFEAACVLRCDSLAEAQEIVAEDPLVTAGATVPTVVRWDLVGIDTRAIKPQLSL